MSEYTQSKNDLKSDENYQEMVSWIKDQIEYYFSDENLVFDGFLLNKIWNHQKNFVSLKVFLKFNLIKEIFKDYNETFFYFSKINVLADSIEKSDFLVLNKI